MAFEDLLAQGVGPHEAALRVGALHGQAVAAAPKLYEMAQQRKAAERARR